MGQDQLVAELPKSLPGRPIEEATNEEVAGIPIGELIRKLSDPKFDRKSFQDKLSKNEKKKLIKLASEIKRQSTLTSEGTTPDAGME